MRYFVFMQRWSQTDEGLCIVAAENKEAARLAIKSNARYIDYVGETGYIMGEQKCVSS